ncbi:hypothetical protein H9660_13185 [Clostridium sp. Sa3CUN1]|uniref:Uncharacterized protein n=1 Tax=Clostridium gallinarum TaxID=2762246 RepID=A0ABR8Q6N9_9CLOT|nr:hypothetical protein [Clostridium gallinarum]MBD7916102.1 hypothetical protein [Clostridium gallinarum]
MLRVDRNKHCSLNKSVRELFYMKQNINNSRSYSEEEKIHLTRKIERDIYNIWEKAKYDLEVRKV